MKTHPLQKQAESWLKELEEDRRLGRKTIAHYKLELALLLELLPSADDTFPLRDHLRHMAAATHLRKLNIWRSFLKTCEHPWKSALDHLKNPKLRRKQPLFLTEEEAFQLEQACYRSPQMTRDRLFVALGLQLGLRLSEILGLKFSAVEGAWLRILRKGEKEQRLPLSPSLQTLISQWKAERVAAEGDWIFPGVPRLDRDEPLTPRAAQALLERLRKLAGLQKEISPHSLRHSFATKLAAEGANLAALKEILGHERLTTTERYLHVTPKHLQEALGLVRGKKGPRDLREPSVDAPDSLG